MRPNPPRKLSLLTLAPIAAAVAFAPAAFADNGYDDDYDDDTDAGNIADAAASPDDHHVPDRAGDFAAARARSANAEERLNRARLVYRAATNEAVAEYREQPAFESSYQAFDSAWEDYRDARDQALDPLRDNEQYQELLARAERIDGALAEAEADGEAGDPALARERLEIAERLASMRDDALRDHEAVADANQAFKQARRELDRMIDQQDQAVENADAVSLAQVAWRDARQQLNVAEVERAEALAEYRAAAALEREDERDDDRLIDAVDDPSRDVDVDVD